MVKAPSIARSELILGGQKSGKSRRAELLARDWMAQSRDHRAVMLATAQPWTRRCASASCATRQTGRNAYPV